jgi:carboxypeptidase Q
VGAPVKPGFGLAGDFPSLAIGRHFVSNPATMKMFLTITWLVSLSVAAFAADSAVDRAMDEALKPSPLTANLQQLTDEIGGRVPGTPAMERAIAWAVAGFKAAGGQNVHTEKFRIPASWAEGDTRVEVISPIRFRVRAVSLAWVAAMPPARARVLDVGDGSPAAFAKAGNVRGAIVLVHSDVLKSWDELFQEYLSGPPVIARAHQAGAAVVAFMSSREHDILYRHLNGIADGGIDPMPQVLLAREDAERIARLIASGKQVEMEIALPNKIGGPIETANVIAEIPGSELPQEWVVLGAHLDSWELGTGALDNGCDAALVIDTLRALHASGLRPRRSIRFILFSGEEQGMLGSWAYVRAHRGELDRADAVVIFDTGTGRVTGFSLGGRRDVADTLAPLIAPLKRWDATALTFDAPVGTDNWDFLLEGVPTLLANQEPANYLVNYHATSDTFDKVDLHNLKTMVAIAAEATTAIANSPERLGPRQSRAEIEQLLRETHADDQMKIFGMWPGWEKGTRGREP